MTALSDDPAGLTKRVRDQVNSLSAWLIANERRAAVPECYDQAVSDLRTLHCALSVALHGLPPLPNPYARYPTEETVP